MRIAISDLTGCCSGTPPTLEVSAGLSNMFRGTKAEAVSWSREAAWLPTPCHPSACNCRLLLKLSVKYEIHACSRLFTHPWMTESWQDGILLCPWTHHRSIAPCTKRVAGTTALKPLLSYQRNGQHIT